MRMTLWRDLGKLRVYEQSATPRVAVLHIDICINQFVQCNNDVRLIMLFLSL